jgi:hypothetical protein
VLFPEESVIRTKVSTMLYSVHVVSYILRATDWWELLSWSVTATRNLPRGFHCKSSLFFRKLIWEWRMSMMSSSFFLSPDENNVAVIDLS